MDDTNREKVERVARLLTDIKSAELAYAAARSEESEAGNRRRAAESRLTDLRKEFTRMAHGSVDPTLMRQLIDGKV